jgi:hypothetical protein
MAWRYFGRTAGLSKVFEIYRTDTTNRPIGFQDALRMERLRPDGSWRTDPSDRALYNEMLSGWFDDNDELSDDQVNQLREEWRVQGWPGRP